MTILIGTSEAAHIFMQLLVQIIRRHFFNTQHHYHFIFPVSFCNRTNLEMCDCSKVSSKAVDSGHRRRNYYGTCSTYTVFIRAQCVCGGGWSAPHPGQNSGIKVSTSGL